MLRNIASTFGSKLLVSLLNLAIVIIISRYLGAEGRGVSGIFVSTLAFIALFNNFMGGSMIVYLVPRYPLLSLFAPAYLWAAAVSGFFFFLLPFTDFISPEFRTDIFFISLLQSLTGVNLMILLGRERIAAHNIITAFQVVVNISVLLILFIFAEKISIDSYIWSLYAATITGFALTMISVLPLMKHAPGQGKNPLKDIFRFGFMLQLAALAQFLSYRISFYFLEQYRGEEAVGVYANGCSLAEAIWLVGNSISLIQYARLVNSSDKDYALEVSKKLTRVNVAITLGALIPLVLIPSSFYSFLFGKDFTGVQEVIWTLAPGILSFGFTLICSHYFAGTGAYWINTIASSLGLVAAVIGCRLLIPELGIIGAGIASSISYIVTTLFVVIIFVRKTKTSFIELVPGPGDLTEMIRQVRQLKPTGK